jgi:hypothetical protein
VSCSFFFFPDLLSLIVAVLMPAGAIMTANEEVTTAIAVHLFDSLLHG